MISRRPIVTLIVLIAIGSPAAVRSVRDDDGNGREAVVSRVRGRVVTGDRQPVRRALVEVVGADTFSAVSDEDGVFDVPALPAGQYRLFASKGGFLRSEYGAGEPAGVGTPIQLDGDHPHDDLTILLARGAVLAGSIRDVDGAPAADVVVTATSGRMTHEVWTDDRGGFRIYGLPPGSYTLSAQPQKGVAKYLNPVAVMTTSQIDDLFALLKAGRRALPRDTSASTMLTTADRGAALPRPAASVVTGYAPVLYPGTVNAAQATALVVAEGEERLGLDFALLMTGTGRIHGTVAGVDGAAAAGVFVTVSPAGGQRTELHPTFSRGGTFDLTDLPPGSYSIEARVMNTASGGSTARGVRPYAAWAVADAVVAGEDAVNVVLTLQRPLTFSGRVTIDPGGDGGPVVARGLPLTLVKTNAIAGEPPTASAIVGANGTFSFTGLGPGTYRLLVGQAGASTIALWPRSAVVDGRDVLDPALEFGPAAGSLRDVVLTVSARHTALSGTLKTPTNVAASAYLVVAFAADPSMWHPASRRVSAVKPDVTGRFAFDDLPPGDYRLGVLGRVTAGDWRSPEILQGLTPVSVPVTLGEGERAIQDLQIAAAP